MEDLRGHGERLDKFTAALNAWAEQARCGIARHMDRQIADIICAPAPTPRFDVDKRLAEITPPCDDCAAPDSMTYPQGCDQCSRTPEQREAHRRK
jgi:hypothetical protein